MEYDPEILLSCLSIHAFAPTHHMMPHILHLRESRESLDKRQSSDFELTVCKAASEVNPFSLLIMQLQLFCC